MLGNPAVQLLLPRGVLVPPAHQKEQVLRGAIRAQGHQAPVCGQGGAKQCSHSGSAGEAEGHEEREPGERDGGVLFSLAVRLAAQRTGEDGVKGEGRDQVAQDAAAVHAEVRDEPALVRGLPKKARQHLHCPINQGLHTANVNNTEPAAAVRHRASRHQA